MTRLLIIALSLAALAYPSAAHSEIVLGPARVIDGDSIEVAGTEIRLHGIDAPEGRQTCTRDGLEWLCGAEASKRLRELLAGKNVHCQGHEWDRHGRLIAKCHVGGPDGPDLGAQMVRSGWALAFRRYSAEYVPQEQEAQATARGLWSGQFVPPWEWRKGQRQKAAASSAPTGDCVIKGNINKKGVRIYHVPGMKYYRETRINTAKGERWFCTEAEARAAGWRRAKQ